MKSRRTLWCILALALSVGSAFAESYPSKSIRIIVPFGPGSGSDVIARLFAKYLQERWKQSVVVDNRPGASGLIGTEALKKSAPDGYTLGMATNSTHAAAPHLFKKLPYDPVKDFEHVGLFGTIAAVAVVPVTSLFKSLPELVAYAKANPDKVFFGYVDTSSQIPGELLKVTADIPIEGVSYKTVSNVLTDLIGGHIQFMFVNYVAASPHIAGGRVMPIAVTDLKRAALWPNVPTVAETYPGFEVRGFVALAAPRSTPKEIIAKLNRAMRDAQADPVFKAPLEKTGATLTQSTPEEYRAFLLKETERWRQWIRMAKIAPQ